jgi:site-specific recombinase XerD
MKEQALAELKERLSSPRLRAPTTIQTYLETAERFLDMVKDADIPTDSHIRRYFIKRREGGISERTLTKEFTHLKKLFLCNRWPWEFTSDDTPRADEKKKLPVLHPSDVEKLIAARAKYDLTERFYLAVATTWIVRREELARIKKRDYDDETITIHTAKHGRRRQHPIPEPLKPIFQRFRAREHTPTALSILFQRICKKAGVKLQPRSGWHSLRYIVNSELRRALISNREDPIILVDYGGWVRDRGAGSFGDLTMSEYYSRPEVRFPNTVARDKFIYSVHPFLHLRQGKPAQKPPVKDQPRGLADN